MIIAWDELYRPSKSLDEFVIDTDIKNKILEYINKGTFCNSMFHGVPGIGKTTLMKLIPNLIPDTSVLFLNACDDNGIGTVREKIKSFTQLNGFNGGLKFVLMDEVERVTSDAWETLRGVIDSAKDTCFIMTCNDNTKVINGINDRLTYWNFKFDSKMILKRLVEILKKENIQITREQIKDIHDNIVIPNYPHIRKIIKHLQHCCLNGHYIYTDYDMDQTEIDVLIDKILQLQKSDLLTIHETRKYWLDNENIFSRDYNLLAQKIFNKINDYQKMSIIADHILNMTKVIDKEIEFTHMIINLLTLEK